MHTVQCIGRGLYNAKSICLWGASVWNSFLIVSSSSSSSSREAGQQHGAWLPRRRKLQGANEWVIPRESLIVAAAAQTDRRTQSRKRLLAGSLSARRPTRQHHHPYLDQLHQWADYRLHWNYSPSRPLPKSLLGRYVASTDVEFLSNFCESKMNQLLHLGVWLKLNASQWCSPRVMV